MVSMAHRDQYDVAYLLSADGDFVPAVMEVRNLGRKVFAASPSKGNQLVEAVNAFLPLKKAWFDGLRLNKT